MKLKSKKLYIILASFTFLSSCDKDFLNNIFSPKIEIKEQRGNGDNIPNKGEELSLIVSLNGSEKNGVAGNAVKISSKSSFVKINNETAYSSNGKVDFNIEIDVSTPSNTEIPLNFTYSNSFGLDSISTSSIKIVEIDNKNLFDSLEIKEQRGNGDNIPNKGEEISLTPTFINKGTSASNPLTIKLSSNSSFVKVINETDYIESLKPNAPKKTQGSFNLELDKSVNANTEIPLDFKLTDSFGNEFNTSGSFKIIAVNNSISFDSLEIKEQRGNGDNIPNKGEEISLTPTFINKGTSASNPLTIKLSSNSSFVKVIDETDYIESLKPNAPKKTQGSFNLELDKSVNANTEIPLDFKLTDSFGNEFSTKGSFTVR